MAAPLVHQVNVKATPDAIYDAVSTARGLASFWTSASQAEAKVGSIASFGFGGPTQRMRVDELKPGQRVKWTALADFPNVDGVVALTRSILADDLDEAAVAGTLGIGDDDTIVRGSLPPGTAKTNTNHWWLRSG